jgi:hypothetical protein
MPGGSESMTADPRIWADGRRQARRPACDAWDQRRASRALGSACGVLFLLSSGRPARGETVCYVACNAAGLPAPITRIEPAGVKVTFTIEEVTAELAEGMSMSAPFVRRTYRTANDERDSIGKRA